MRAGGSSVISRPALFQNQWPFNPGGELTPFQGFVLGPLPWSHPSGRKVFEVDDGYGSKAVLLLPLIKPWFVGRKPGGVKAAPAPPTAALPPASAEAPTASNNPAAVTNAR